MLQKSLKYSMNGQDFATESIKTTPVELTKCLPLALLRNEANFFLSSLLRIDCRFYSSVADWQGEEREKSCLAHNLNDAKMDGVRHSHCILNQLKITVGL